MNKDGRLCSLTSPRRPTIAPDAAAEPTVAAKTGGLYRSLLCVVGDVVEAVELLAVAMEHLPDLVALDTAEYALDGDR